ncbi:MAG: Eco47II family restriction endonuclease [Brachymonas sp.]|nr:Eco47II family restriction endonuclease [Brachymonas sp.]
MAGFGSSAQQWEANEKQRQVQKTLQNRIGAFHQTVLGSMNGWQSLPTGGIVDVIHEERKIIAEIKNKFNTMNAGSANNLFNTLDNEVSRKNSSFYGYQAYVVHIIPKTAQGVDQLFAPSNPETGKSRENKLIRQMDGRRFYALASGCDNAMQLVFDDMLRISESYAAKSKNRFGQTEHLVLQAYFKKAFDPTLPSS